MGWAGRVYSDADGARAAARAARQRHLLEEQKRAEAEAAAAAAAEAAAAAAARASGAGDGVEGRWTEGGQGHNHVGLATQLKRRDSDVDLAMLAGSMSRLMRK